MTPKDYDKAFALGMAIVFILVLSLILATLEGCQVHKTTTIKIGKNA